MLQTNSHPTGLWKLPPLILHPFSGEQGPESLLAGSRAALILNGMVPRESEDYHELQRLVLKGRVQELKMLYFLGKDLLRWAEQCQEFVSAIPAIGDVGIREQSFIAMLVDAPPKAVFDKLTSWGVHDQKAVFSRAVGMNSVLAQPPSMETLATTFLLNYHRFSDYLYVCYQNLVPFATIRHANFPFDLFASAEYSEMLSQEWEKDEQKPVR